MNDIIEAISARIKAPYFGYAMLAFIALNWRGIFLLAATPGSPQVRLGAFDSVTSFTSLIVWPLVAGALVAVCSPWIKLAFSYLSRRPFEYIDNLHLHAEHKKTIRRTELERSRSELFASKETELIERAKRDEEVLQIENESVQEQLKAELELLRKERDRMSHGLYGSEAVQLSPTERELLALAAKSGSGTISRNEYLSGRSIQVGATTFGADSTKDFAKYDSALRSLISKEFVRSMGAGGSSFELTHTGWQIADTL